MLSMTPRRNVICAAAGLVLIGAQLFVAGQDRPSFRSSTRLVELSVVVTDRDRNPVDGLTASDFQVFDDGKPQHVELFVIEGTSAAAPRSKMAPARNAREFSNRLPDTGGVTIVLYDQLNTPTAARMNARVHVARFLEQIKPDDRIGLYVLDPSGSLRVVHDFTSDASSLVRAVSGLSGNTSLTLSGAEDATRLEEELASVFADDQQAMSGTRAMREHFTGVAAVVTVDALESIGRYLSGVRNRKNLIWVSAGFPLAAFDYRGRSKTGEINRATRALNDANVALYTVDARGLLPALTAAQGQPMFTTLATVATNQDILKSVAEDTGGRAFLNTNDINGAIRRAADDARMTYVLGYYPTNAVWDGRFHRIAVRVNRPGLEARHRKGYFAVASERQAMSQRAAALNAAVASPINASGLGLTVRIDPVPSTGDQYHLAVHVEPSAIALEPRGNESLGGLDVVVAQVRADGADGRSFDHAVNIRVPADRLSQFLRDGVTFDHTLTLASATERVRVVVRDIRTGAMGAIGVTRKQLQDLER
jgi:VWFA-related protein